MDDTETAKEPRRESHPVIDLVYYHYSTQSQVQTDAYTPKTQPIPYEELQPLVPSSYTLIEDVKKRPVDLRISHQYRDAAKSSGHGEDAVDIPEQDKTSPPLWQCSEHLEDTIRTDRPVPNWDTIFEKKISGLGPQAGSEWYSNALLDQILSDPAPRFLPEPGADEEVLIDLDRFCRYCRYMCEASRALNRRVHEEDPRMPASEPPYEKVDGAPRFPSRQIREYFDFHPSSGHLLESARSGCHLCTVICHRLVQKSGRFLRTRHELGPASRAAAMFHLPSAPVKLGVSWSWWFPSAEGPKGKSGAVLRLLQVLWPTGHLDIKSLHIDASYQAEEQPSGSCHPPLAENTKDRHLLSCWTGSTAVLELARGWIDTCRNEHSLCVTTDVRFRPTRLLDVGGPDGRPKLDTRPSDGGTEIVYLALSHCWGKQDLYKLTSRTEYELMQGVEVSRLSRTFQDAIRVCRGMGQRYIWIDSLCIMQDSAEDWAREAAQMHRVYSNALFTIAGVCGRGSEEGFLRWRDPLIQQPCKLPTKVGISISGDTHWPETQPERSVEPLFLRAWTLQERLLSARVLKFGEENVSWECRECMLTEGGLASNLRIRDEKASRIQMTQICEATDVGGSPRSQATFIDLWRALVANYTTLALTKPQDRLAAFHGITSRIASKTGVVFFDGIPIDAFVPALLWRWHYGQGRRPVQEVTETATKTYLTATSSVNTLSWASIEGAVKYTRPWPFCPATSVPAGGINNALVLRERLQIIELSARPAQSAELPQKREMLESIELAHVRKSQSFSGPYRYCTRLLDLQASRTGDNQPSRATLEGPTWSFTTECTRGPKMINKCDWTSFWNHPVRKEAQSVGGGGWFTPDFLWLRIAPVGLSMNVTCLTLIEWNHEWEGEARDMSGEDPKSWEPTRAAGIALVKSGGDASAAVYTRIGYWELGDDIYRSEIPPYGPIRDEAVVRRVTIT